MRMETNLGWDCRDWFKSLCDSFSSARDISGEGGAFIMKLLVFLLLPAFFTGPVIRAQKIKVFNHRKF